MRSKNNLPSLYTAHWGWLVKESVSKERQSQSSGEARQKEDSKETQKEGGIKMENGARVGGQWQEWEQKRQRRKRAGKDVGQMDLQVSENEFMKL